jgi:hypothetical protein
MAFKHVRLFVFEGFHDSWIALHALKLFDESGDRIATSCTASNYECTASSQWSSNYAASKAFDGSSSSYWSTSTNKVTDQWIRITFQQPIIMTSFSVLAQYYRPKDFVLQGSNVASPSNTINSTDWITLRSVTDWPDTDGEVTFQLECEVRMAEDNDSIITVIVIVVTAIIIFAIIFAIIDLRAHHHHQLAIIRRGKAKIADDSAAAGQLKDEEAAVPTSSTAASRNLTASRGFHGFCRPAFFRGCPT